MYILYDVSQQWVWSCVPCCRMLSNRVAAKRAYHRRVEKMDSLQKENNFLVQVLAERQQRQHKLEALVRSSMAVRSSQGAV